MVDHDGVTRRDANSSPPPTASVPSDDPSGSRQHSGSGIARSSAKPTPLEYAVGDLAWRPAAHSKRDLHRKFADLCVAELSQSAARLNQTLFPDDGNIFGTRRAVSLQTGFACGQKNMRGEVLVDARGQGHHKYGVRAFVTITRVERHDNDWSSAFIRRIDVQLDKPYLTAKRVSGNGKGRHSGMPFAGRLTESEVAPLRLLLYLFVGECRVVSCHGLFKSLAVLCPTNALDQLIENRRDRCRATRSGYFLKKRDRLGRKSIALPGLARSVNDTPACILLTILPFIGSGRFTY